MKVIIGHRHLTISENPSDKANTDNDNIESEEKQ